MSETKWKWLLLLALAAIAPFLYANVQAYWAFLLVPVGEILSVSGKVPNAILNGVMSFCGALIVAALLSLPLGYVAKNKPYLFGALLSLAPLVFLVSVLEDQQNVTTFLRVIRVAEYLSIVVAFTAMARLGAHLRALRHKPDAVRQRAVS